MSRSHWSVDGSVRCLRSLARRAIPGRLVWPPRSIESAHRGLPQTDQRFPYQPEIEGVEF